MRTGSFVVLAARHLARSRAPPMVVASHSLQLGDEGRIPPGRLQSCTFAPGTEDSHLRDDVSPKCCRHELRSGDGRRLECQGRELEAAVMLVGTGFQFIVALMAKTESDTFVKHAA